MAGLFDDRQKKKKELVQKTQASKGSGNTAPSSNRQYGNFSDFFEARRQQEAAEDYKRWGENAAAKRAAIDGALRVAQQNRKKPANPVTLSAAATTNVSNDANPIVQMKDRLHELAEKAVAAKAERAAQEKARRNQEFRVAARTGYHPNRVNVDPAQLAEFSKYSFENRTADENLKGYVAAEQENRRPKSAGFVNPISTNNTYNFGDTIRAKQTGAGGNVSQDGRRIGSASVNYEESFKSAYAPQREAAIAAAQNDSNNPMNLANQFLERNAVEDVGHNARWKESAAYSKMTDDEKAVYNYVYSTYGPARAEEYKNGLMDELNARVGQDIYSNNIEAANTAEKALYSYGAGFMSGLEGVANAPAAFLGVENRQATDPEQLASSYLRSDEDNNRAQQILYDIASSTGNMTPGIIMSAAGVPSALSTVEFGAAQAGNAYNQALQNGNTASQSSAYAVQQFADEQLTNMLLNGVNAFGGGLVQRTIGAGPVGQAINRAIDKVAKTDTGRRLLRSIMRSIGNAAGEAQQEYLQFYTENFTQALLGMKDENGNVVQMNLNPADPEALYSAALGALNAFALNTPSDISRVIGGARADVSDARSIADSIAESTREDYSSDEAFEQAQELRAVSEEIARKQEAGVEVTAADRIAFNESMSDMIQIGTESEEETEEYASNQVEGFDDELEDASMTEEIANERQAGIEELAKDMGENGAAAFSGNYGNSGTENIMDYSSAFKMLYNAAKAGDEDALALARNSDAAQKLTFEQQSAAVSAGVADAKAEALRTEGQDALRSFEAAESVRLPESVREDMINAYNGDVRMDAYQQAYKRAFVAGENGVDLAAAKRSPLVTTYLNRSQFEQAYNAGAELAGVVNSPAFKNGPARNGGLTYADKDATKAQKKIAKWVGNKTGLSVEIRSDIKGGAEIDIKNGILRVNPHSKNFNQSISHELTHLIRQYDPEGYNKYRELAVDALMNSRGQSYDQLYELYESKYAETGTTPNVDDVIEEMVADASGQFLNDEEFINKVVQEDRSLAEKIIDFFRGIVDALRESMSQEGLSNTSKALRENYETYSKALDVWTNALNNSAESYQSGITVDDSASIESSPAYTGEYPKEEKARLKADKTGKRKPNPSATSIEVAADDPSNTNVIREGSDKDIRYSLPMDEALDDNLRVNMATFFSGSGTVDFALRNIVHHEFAVEYDAKIAAVYRANNGDNIYVDDVRNVDIDPHKGKVEYFHASPVCKSYSNANNDQGEKPLDIETARATAEAISTLQPKVITVENVARYKNSEAIKLIEDALKENGYEYDKNVYRASDFGGATIRERMFLRAVKDGVLPEIDTSEYEPMSWYEAVEDLIPSLPDAELKGYMKDRLEVSGIDIDNLEQPVFILGGEKSGKLTWAYADEPAPTLLAKSTEAKILMPDGRVLRATPRVMARIQGLPDAFDLKDGKGGMTNAYKVVGNGIPVQLTQGIVGPLLEENLIKQKSESKGIKYQIDDEELAIAHPKIARDTGYMNDNGDTLAKNYRRYSLGTFDSVGRKNLSDYLKNEVASKNMTKKTADKITKQMEWAYEMVQKYSKTGEFPMFSAWQTAEYKLQEDGTPVFSVVVPNGEYSLNLDFTTVCKKRDTLDQVLTALAQSGNLNYKKLNQKQLAKINEIIKRNGFEIACSTCFVDSKRYNISNWAHSLTDGTKSRNGYNQAIASMLNDKVGAEYFNYVSSATQYNGKDTYTAGQRLLSDLSNEELLELNPHAFDYIDKRMKEISPKSYEYRMLKAIKENQSLRSFLNANDFISSMGQDIIQEQNPALHTLLQSLGGSSRPKPSHGRVAYYSEIVNNNSFTPEAAYKVGGVRVQSFSDYMANMVFDYMQMIADMSAKQLPSHAYTKEPMFAKLYGMTGMKINMSIMPKAVDWVKILGIGDLSNAWQAVRIHDAKQALSEKQKRQLREYAGLEMQMDENGNFVPVTDENGRYIPIVDDETFPMEEALAIRSAEGYKQNCGTIWIGTSDEQIRTLLRMEEADMVIPYHASSLNPAVKEMRNIEFMHDYTAQQRTRRKENGKWKAIPAINEFDFYESLMRTKDGKTTADEYLAWCDKHGYRPKFDQFRKEDNYYKLLEDFRLYDGDVSAMQGAVQMNFPGADSAFGDFESLMKESLQESNATANSLGQKLPDILDQINNELGLNSTKSLRHQLDFDDSDTGFETDVLFNDNKDIQAASETLGKILSGIDEMPSKKAIADTVTQLRKATKTNMSAEKIKEHLNTLYEYLAFNRNVDGADISHIAADLAGEMIQNSTKVNESDRANYNEYRNFLRSYTFHMPAGFEGEVEKLGGVGALRKEFFGTLNITNEKGLQIDEIWDELSDQYPEYFGKDITNPADMLEQIVDITRSLKPSPEIDSMKEEDFDVYRYSVGQDILKAFVDNGADAAMRDKYDQLLKKGLQKAKDKAKAQKDKAKLRRMDREARTNLLTKANRLARMKGGPAFEAAKESLIGDLDLIAKGMNKNTKAKLQEFQRRAEELAAKDENYKELYFDSAKEVFGRLSKTQIKDMTGEEVEELTNKIVELIHQERTTKQMLNESQGIMAATVARRAMSQQDRVKGIDDRHIIKSFFGRWKLNMLNPTRAFQRIDGYQNQGVFTELGKQLNDGQTKMNYFVMKASKKFNGFLEQHPDLVKTWSTADIDTGFKDKNGKPVYISKGMRIALYLHSLNTQNERHIANGGIKIPDANLYNKGKYTAAYRYGAELKLQPTDLRAITAGMTEDEKAFAKLAHEFLNVDTKNAINETSLTLSGTMKAMVEDYFPIRSDPNFTMRDITGLVMDGTIEGMGMMKERIKGASNQILLEDVAQVLQRQTNNTARYYGLAIPVRDFNKVMKFKEAGVTESVRSAVDKAWGDAGINYITDVLNNIQAGAPADNGPGARLFNSLKSTYAGTVLNWNLGVAIKQSASAPFAAVVLDAPSVAKALFTPQGLKKVDYDYMDSITPWSYMRRQGASGTEMGEVYKQKNAVESNRAWQKFKSATNFIQNVDVWTTNRLFNATEMYVQSHYPDLEVRGEEYNRIVAETYNEMLQRTQPSYDVMQRNAYLRSGNVLTKVMGMFKTQTFNMGGEVIDAAGRLSAYERLRKEGRISEEQLKEARGQFGKTVTATAVSQLMLAALGIVAKAVMHNMKGYRDDKGEVTPESVAAQGMYEFLTSFAGLGMGGNELQSYLLSLSGKEKWYDIAYPGLSVANELASSSVEMADAFRKALDKGWDADSVANLKKKIAQFTMNAAIMKRIPADNLYKIANAIHLHYEDWKKGMPLSFDSGEGLFDLRDSSVSKKEYAKQAIYEYGAGNDARAEYALGNTGKTQLEDALGAEASYDENGDTISGSKQADALNKINDLDISNEAKANLIGTMYPKLDVDPELITEFIDMNAAKTEGKQDGVVEYLNDSNLSDESKRKLWELAGYKESTYEKKVGSPTRSMPTRGGYITPEDNYEVDTSLKGRLKLAWELFTDTENVPPDMRLKSVLAALTNDYTTPDISEFNTPEFYSAFRREPSKKQRKITGTATVQKGEPIFWDEDAFNFIMENWPAEITAPYQEMYDNYQSPSPEEVKALIDAHPEQEQYKSWPISENPTAAVPVVRQEIDNAETVADKVKVAHDYITDTLGMTIDFNTLNDMREGGMPSDYIREMFNLLPKEQQKMYVETSWPYDLQQKYRNSDFTWSPGKFEQMVKENWNAVEAKKDLKRLAFAATRNR